MSEDITKNNNNSVLGKGLASLIPQNKFVSNEDTSARVLMINVNKILPNPYQPRKEFDEESLQELADSIKMHGILEPLIVTKKQNGNYEIVAGERRLRAAQKVKLEEVPVIVKEADERQKLAWALTENLQRQNLNAIEEAFAYKFLRDEYGLDSQEIAAGFSHRSDSSVRNIMRLLELPPMIQTGVKEGKISPTCARIILSLPHEDQRIALYQLAIKAHLSKPALEERVNRILNQNRYVQSRPGRLYETKPEIREAEEKLSSFLDCHVRILRSNGRGQITLEFGSIDKLHEMVGKIIR